MYMQNNIQLCMYIELPSLITVHYSGCSYMVVILMVPVLYYTYALYSLRQKSLPSVLLKRVVLKFVKFMFLQQSRLKN